MFQKAGPCAGECAAQASFSQRHPNQQRESCFLVFEVDYIIIARFTQLCSEKLMCLHSSAGQSVRLLTARSTVQSRLEATILQKVNVQRIYSSIAQINLYYLLSIIFIHCMMILGAVENYFVNIYRAKLCCFICK
ncbi:Hypothetical_protein [Hexamita inflata]|uniref:Hypothetical_protein n=1 Tax=Hexamita inflata TaxID=28002 RepID=A0AA86UQ39_9EUKA|nr:Hypothetical protein HINF_LOCUS34443 [Hexamita inflata]